MRNDLAVFRAVRGVRPAASREGQLTGDQSNAPAARFWPTAAPWQPMSEISASAFGVDPLRPVANVGYLELKTIETFPHESRLKLYRTAFQGTTLIYLREMHDLRTTIT